MGKQYQKTNNSTLSKLLALLVLVFVAIVLLYSITIEKPSNTLESKQNNLSSSNPNNIGEYTGGEIFSSGFEYIVPAGWKVAISKDMSLKDVDRINVDFAPPGWVRPADILQKDWYGWGTLFVDVYSPVNSIEEWLQVQYPGVDYLVYENITIGNKIGYLVIPGPDAQDYEREFRDRRVVIGSKYTYVLGFSEGYHSDEAIPISEQTLKNLIFE